MNISTLCADKTFSICEVETNELYDKPHIIDPLRIELIRCLNNDDGFSTEIWRDGFERIYRIIGYGYEDIYIILYRTGMIPEHYFVLMHVNESTKAVKIFQVGILKKAEELKSVVPIIIPKIKATPR
jgi:hypothetical protein